jgi:hypothetical protein
MGLMMSKTQRFSLESGLYLLAFLLALALRLLNLGQTPLTDGEAAWALQALQVARPGTGVFIPGAQPAYIFLTGGTFAIFGASEFWARIWPALAGALLVWAPYFFRHRLGRKTAVILAFGLAIDPGLVTVSRQAGGPMLALSFTLLALALWHDRRPGWAGLLGGLALLSGPSFWAGALGLGLAGLIYRLLYRSVPPPGHVFDETSEVAQPAAFPSRREALRGLAVLLATLLVVGAGLMRYPQGLAAAFAGLTTYLAGWATSSGISPLTLVGALLVFQPLGVIFAILSLGRWLARRFQHETALAYPLMFPLLWLMTSLVLTLLYPARQVSDLVWVVVPLWALAADGLAEYLPDERPHVVSWLQAGLVVVLAALFWNTLIATSQIVPESQLPWGVLQLGILTGILLLGALTTALVALGWSWTISRDGLVWGVVISFVVYSTNVLWGAAQLRPGQPEELWGPPPGAGQAGLALETLTDLSNWETGLVRKIDLVSTVDTPSLRWMLRDFAGARFATEVPVGEMPAVILTRSDAEAPALTASYRGQDFVWWVRPAWEGPLPEDFVGWLTFRKAKVGYDYIILWARGDLFPGGAPLVGEAP